MNVLPLLLLLLCFTRTLAQPTITQQPRSQTNAVGATATFTVVATGTEPLAYQWQKNESDLPDRTNATLVLPNVQSSDMGDYRVVVTNAEGAVTSEAAHLAVVLPPRIGPSTTLQSAAVGLGKAAAFSASAVGTPPLAYQWQLDGRDLTGQTNRRLSIAAAQPADEGDYTVVVTNAYGLATSEPARLLVVPPVSELVRGDYTNALGRRLPYFYFVPPSYTPTRRYPLTCNFHGSGDNDSVFLSRYTDVRLVGQSYGRQKTDPTILVWPVRRMKEDPPDWTEEHLELTLGLLDRLIAQFNIDTNRIYVGGGSQGVHPTWDILGKRPGFFAAATLLAGWQGNTRASVIKDVPLWVACAADDEMVGPSDSRGLVTALRHAGGNPLYTEYNSGGHVGGIFMALYTPALFDWANAQRRGQPSTAEPLLSISNPTLAPTHATGATNLDLAGVAAALGQAIPRVYWTNLANRAGGDAVGTDLWGVTGIPLVANKTNLIIVTATTTSWAAGYGGQTTFNDALTVICAPLRATLTLQAPGATLTWTGGGPPYTVQRATDLAARDWTDILTNAVPPVPLPLDGTAAFYRIVGQ